MMIRRPDPIPARWAVTVADRLRAIFELLRHWRPLDERDLQQVAHSFVFPNVVHWTFKQRARLTAASYEGECGLLGGQRDCRYAPLLTTSDIAEEDRADLCRQRAMVQPWSMLVTLAFNATGPWRGAAAYSEHPGRACAVEMWRQFLKDEQVQTRWSLAGIQTQANPHVEEAVGKILDGLERLAVETAKGNVDELRVAREEQILERLVRYCLVYYQSLELWIAKQRAGVEADLRSRVNRALEKLLPPLLLARKARWSYFPSRHAAVIAEFLDGLNQLPLQADGQIERILSKVKLTEDEIVMVLRYVAQCVLPALNQGLPKGDPLNDPVFHALFWYRVGSQADATGIPFNLHLWTQRRWSLGDPGTNSAAWELP